MRSSRPATLDGALPGSAHAAYRDRLLASIRTIVRHVVAEKQRNRTTYMSKTIDESENSGRKFPDQADGLEEEAARRGTRASQLRIICAPALLGLDADRWPAFFMRMRS